MEEDEVGMMALEDAKQKELGVVWMMEVLRVQEAEEEVDLVESPVETEVEGAAVADLCCGVQQPIATEGIDIQLCMCVWVISFFIGGTQVVSCSSVPQVLVVYLVRVVNFKKLMLVQYLKTW